jgi:CheY-like chemotaxis protein
MLNVLLRKDAVMRILVVDDEIQVRGAIARMLHDAGYEVAECGDGQSAILAYRRQEADLVLCDLFMPDMDGVEVIRLLRSEFPGVKIIAISGGGSDRSFDLLPLAMQLGAASVLYKPFRQESLIVAISRALRPPIADKDGRSLSTGST